MADLQQLEILKSGVTEWNAWRKKYPQTKIDVSDADLSSQDLRGADLDEAYLYKADLSEANLSGANLSVTNLSCANLIRASLNSANLSGTDLHSADLSEADLHNADLSDANLSWTNLRETFLDRANLSRALLYETAFVNAYLHTATGLDSCQHLGPSILDHRTLMQSGSLPLAFLRGCGLPDSLIEYLPSLLGAGPIQFHSCFISYSTQDQDFANQLHADLQNKGVRCWFAPHKIQGGKKIHEQIDEAIRLYDRLLLILSEHSMNSEWVKTEIAHARQKEVNENRRVLYPISLVPFDAIKAWKNFDADTGKDSAREIREYFIPDFSQWKDHDIYNEAFKRLLQDLKAETQTRAKA